MLARSAESLYWMGRYFERTGHLCRLLRWQVVALVDRPIREIHFGWYRTYDSLGRPLPGADAELVGGSDDYVLVDSFALADDLTFERSNSDSIWSSFASGRENARQMRHHLSAELWTNLNRAWLRFRDQRIEGIWKTAPEAFYAGVADDIDALTGAADATMYHDDGWRFMRMGRCVERAQCTVALILAHFAAVRRTGDALDDDWAGLLRGCQALDAYRGLHGVVLRPERVLDLLVTDVHLPRSVAAGAERVGLDLDAVQAGPGPTAAARDAAVALRRALREDWPSGSSLASRETRVGELQSLCRGLHDRIVAAWVDYPPEDQRPD